MQTRYARPKVLALYYVCAACTYEWYAIICVAVNTTFAIPTYSRSIHYTPAAFSRIGLQNPGYCAVFAVCALDITVIQNNASTLVSFKFNSIRAHINHIQSALPQFAQGLSVCAPLSPPPPPGSYVCIVTQCLCSDGSPYARTLDPFCIP